NVLRRNDNSLLLLIVIVARLEDKSVLSTSFSEKHQLAALYLPVPSRIAFDIVAVVRPAVNTSCFCWCIRLCSPCRRRCACFKKPCLVSDVLPEAIFKLLCDVQFCQSCRNSHNWDDKERRRCNDVLAPLTCAYGNFKAIWMSADGYVSAPSCTRRSPEGACLSCLNKEPRCRLCRIS